MDISYEVIRKYKVSVEKSNSALSEIAKVVFNENKNKYLNPSLEIVVLKSINGKMCNTQISHYNDFFIKENVVTEGIGIFTGGIKTGESLEFIHREIEKSEIVNASYIFTKLFNYLSCETIGGYLKIYEFKDKPRLLSNNKITDRDTILRLHTDFNPNLIIAETLYGKIVLSQRVIVGDAAGIWLMEGPRTTIKDRHGRIAMMLGLYEENPDKFGMIINRYNGNDVNSTLINKVIANSEDGFKIQRWNGHSFDDKLHLDTDGNIFGQDITAKRLKIISDQNELLLDSYTKEMNIGKFDNIITDGKLTAIEKLQVIGERTRIISEYAKLLDQANIYKTTSRDDTVRIDIPPFTAAYNALIAYLSPLLSNMTETSAIDRNEFIQCFKLYYDQVVAIVNAINDSIKYSSLQLGSLYNNVLLDSIDGITVTRSDELYRTRLNATDGISIQKKINNQWVKRFWVNVEDARLWAEELVAKSLKIVSSLNDVFMDIDSSYLDIGRFTTIITDNKLTSIEKLSLLQEWQTIQTEYTKLLQQANQYKTSVRDNYQTVLIDIPPFTSSFNDLAAYVLPLLADMSATTEIDRNVFKTKFQTYYDQAQRIINEITDAVKWSSVQLGQMYNKVILDSENGVMATRSDDMYRSIMNAIKGFAIQKNIGSVSSPNWIDQFWADTSGIIHAEGIKINNSIITEGGIEGAYIILRDDIGGIMKLYPSTGFWAGAENASDAPTWIKPDGEAIFKKLIVKNGVNGGLMIDSVNKFIDMNFWDLKGAGAISAELISANLVSAQWGFISDLTAQKVVTMDRSAIGGWSNFVVVEDNYIQWITGIATQGSQKALSDGRLLYWVNSSQTGQMTTETTAWPVYEYSVDPNNKKIKAAMGFEGTADSAQPYIRLGLGDGATSTSGIGRFDKYNGGLKINYGNSNYGLERGLDLRDDGVYLTSTSGKTIISTKDFTISSDNGTVKIGNTSGALIEIRPDNKIAFKATEFLFENI
jgi:hypothetical protein